MRFGDPCANSSSIPTFTHGARRKGANSSWQEVETCERPQPLIPIKSTAAVKVKLQNDRSFALKSVTGLYGPSADGRDVSEHASKVGCYHSSQLPGLAMP